MEDFKERLCMNVRELAIALGISVNHAYNLANRSDFPAIKLGKRITIPREEFKEWLAKSKDGSRVIF